MTPLPPYKGKMVFTTHPNPQLPIYRENTQVKIAYMVFLHQRAEGGML